MKTLSKMSFLSSALSSGLNSAVIATAVSAMFFVGGCAKDRTTDDYKTEQFQQDFAKLASANGNFTGTAVSEADPSVTSPMALVLQAQSQKLASTDQTKASLQPVLTAEMHLQSADEDMHIQATDSTYDEQTGSYKTTISINRTENNLAKTYTVDINGVIHQDTGTIDGTVEVEGYAGYGFKFHLSRAGKPFTQLTAEATVKPNLVLSQGNYGGSTHFLDGDTHFSAATLDKTASLTLVNPRSSTDVDFLTALVPTKTVTATLDYGDGALVSFTNAIWDQTNGQLTGTGNISTSYQMAQSAGSTSSASSGTTATSTSSSSTAASSGIQIYLNCVAVPATGGFDCKHSAQNAPGGYVAESIFTPLAAGVKPNLQDDPSNRNGKSISYKGSGKFPDPFHPGQTMNKTFTFQVTYPLRTKQQEIGDLFAPDSEKYVVVSFAFDEGIPGTQISPTKFDEYSHSLNGLSTYQTTNGIAATQTIACSNFDFVPASKPYNFSCNYNNTVTGANIALNMKN